MRHQHPPGEKAFVDWAGQTVPLHEADGRMSEASVFIAVLGASNKTFASVSAVKWLVSAPSSSAGKALSISDSGFNPNVTAIAIGSTRYSVCPS